MFSLLLDKIYIKKKYSCTLLWFLMIERMEETDVTFVYVPKFVTFVHFQQGIIKAWHIIFTSGYNIIFFWVVTLGFENRSRI